MTRPGLLLLVLLLLGLAACQSDGVSVPSDSSTSSPETSEAGDIPIPSATGAAELPNVTSLGTVDDLSLDGDEVACVRAELGEGLDPERVPQQDLDAAATACIRGGEFAQAFVEVLAEDNPGLYSADELGCLADAYGDLTDEELGALMLAGLQPSDPPPEAAGVLDGLFGGCGVSPPG